MSEESPPAEAAKAEPPKESAPAPSGAILLELHGRTDVGLVREHNEDSFLAVRLDDNSRDPEQLKKHELGKRGTLCVVCDGMGGAAAGEVASNMAVESIAGTMLGDATPTAPEGQTDDAHTAIARKLRMAAKNANSQIFHEARSNLARSGMGTTMTAAFFHDNWATVAQVGDSRAYVWRAGHFAQVTRDQSLVNQLLETGHITPEQAKFFEHSNVILQALGVQEEVEVQLSKVELRKGDRFMLCSDGLVGVVTDEEIGAVMGACDDPAETARILIEMANGAGGPDNISVIVAYVAGDGAPAPTAADKVEYKLWKIDPDIPLVAPDESSPEATTQDPPTRAAVHLPRRQAGNPTAELISMAVIVGLVLGSLLTGAVIYKNGVVCHVEARKEGLSVLADGRDTGIRTRVDEGQNGAIGTVRVRLRPGHHVLTLRGQGAPDVTRELDVRRGASCEASFAGELTGAPPVPESESHTAAIPVLPTLPGPAR